MTIVTDHELCTDPDLCRDPACESAAAHLPDRDDTTWGDAEEMASWIEDDTRQWRRWEP